MRSETKTSIDMQDEVFTVSNPLYLTIFHSRKKLKPRHLFVPPDANFEFISPFKLNNKNFVEILPGTLHPGIKTTLHDMPSESRSFQQNCLFGAVIKYDMQQNTNLRHVSPIPERIETEPSPCCLFQPLALEYVARDEAEM